MYYLFSPPKDLETRARDQAQHIMQMLQVYETHHSKDTTNNIPEVCIIVSFVIFWPFHEGCIIILPLSSLEPMD